MRKISVILVFLSLLTAVRAAVPLQHLGLSDGLSSRKVYQVAADFDGYLWFYTQNGIDRYDGTEFRRYELDEQVSSRDFIQASSRLTSDIDGIVWVAVRTGLIYRFDAPADRFVRVCDMRDVLSADATVNAILPLGGDDFLAGTSDGLFSVGPSGIGSRYLEGHYVSDVQFGADGRIYICTREGLWTWTGMSLQRDVRMPGVFASCVHEEGTRLFCGTFSDGLYAGDRDGGPMERVEGVPEVPVRVITGLDAGRILVGTDGAGVFVLDPRTCEILDHWFPVSSVNESLAAGTVSDILVQENGFIWVATTTNGISYFRPAIEEVSWIRHEQGNPLSIADDHVNVIYQDRDGDMWYGTNNGLDLWMNGRCTHFLEGGNVMLAVTQDWKGNIWAGGYGTGLYRIDKRSGRCDKIDTDVTDYIYYIMPDRDNIWVGGIEYNLARVDINTLHSTIFPLDCIGDIWEYGGRLILAGCSGLGMLDPATGEYSWQREIGEYVLQYPVRALFASSSGEVWLATDGNGLIRYNIETGEAACVSSDSGLLSDSILSVQEDLSGRIWFAAEEGLYFMEPGSLVPVLANDLLEISGGIFNPNAAWRMSDGRLAFGTSEGVFIFDPAGLSYLAPSSVRPIFTEFAVDYETVVPSEGGILPKCIDYWGHIKLSHSRNSFSISFSSVNFSSAFRLRYEYMLEGYDDRWISSGVPGTASYVKVPSGRYVFMLRAIDNYTGEPVGVRCRNITIKPPLYLSWWAMLVYLALAGAATVLAVRYRRRKAYEEGIRAQIDTFATVAHDLKTPVTLIKAPLGELGNIEGLPDAARGPIDTAMKNADKLLSMIGDLLDLRRTEEGLGRLTVTKIDLPAYLEARVGEIRPAALKKGLEVSLDVGSSIETVLTDRESLDHIVRNLLSNALKYTTEGSIDVSAEDLGESWMLAVTDTGIGIPDEARKRLFSGRYRSSEAEEIDSSGYGIGLMLASQMARNLSGTISYKSVPGKGTRFMVSLPKKYKDAEIVEDTVAEGVVAPVEPEAGKNTLLLVEDETDLGAYLAEALSSEYKVLVTGNGNEGLSMAREMNPDIIVSDVVMPVMRGDEMCRILKSSLDTSHIPVILLTGLGDRQSIIMGLEAGASDYVTKPFDLSVLRLRLRNILSERQRLRDSLTGEEKAVPDYGSRLDQEFMEKVMAVIEANIAEPEFSIADMCRELGMSRTSIFNKIKTLTGQGPNDFIRIVRLNRAKDLLQDRRYQIAEVSDMVGFSDPKYFSVCFKKQFGVSPSKI